MKIGLELEYWVTDDKGELVSSQELAESLDFAEQEFVHPLIEIKTTPHEEIEELRKEVKEKLGKLCREAENLDQCIIPLGTPLDSEGIEALPSRRGKIQRKIIGDNLEAAKRVAGTHIHFEQEDVKQQLNTLTALDPALALLNSSPYYQGKRPASSSRSQVYRYQCYRNFPKHGQLWTYTDSVSEWENRIHKRFEEFVEAAKKQGIDQNELEEYFTPFNALWNPVRLRKDFPTVEWRAPDTGRVDDVLRAAEETKRIMESPEQLAKPDFEELKSLSEKAIRKGLRSQDVNSYLSRAGYSVDRYSPLSDEIKRQENLDKEKVFELRLQAFNLLKKKLEEI